MVNENVKIKITSERTQVGPFHKQGTDVGLHLVKRGYDPGAVLGKIDERSSANIGLQYSGS